MFLHPFLLLLTPPIFAPLAFASKLVQRHADAPFQQVWLLTTSVIVLILYQPSYFT
jgi:hypothetical protein